MFEYVYYDAIGTMKTPNGNPRDGAQTYTYRAYHFFESLSDWLRVGVRLV